MRSYERQFIDGVIENRAASISSHLRDGLEAESFVAGDDRLTDEGWMFAYGYVSSRLAMLRAVAADDPNLTVEDLAEVRSCIEEHDANIAAEVYA